MLIVDDSPDGIQSETDALALLFCREEWLEDAGEVFLRDALAVVLDLDDDVIIAVPGSYDDPAIAPGRIDSVVDDIGPDLIQRVAERSNRGDPPMEIPLDANVAQAVTEDDQRAFQPVVHIDDLLGCPIHV